MKSIHSEQRQVIMNKGIWRKLYAAIPAKSFKHLLHLLPLCIFLEVSTLNSPADSSEHPSAKEIAKCRLTYEYKDIDKCLLLSGYTRIPNKWPGVFGQSFQFNPPICFVGKFNKLEGRDVDKITVIQLDAGCNESEVLSRRWEFNCENKEVYLYTSDGNRTFYGLWAPRSLGNYACYVFGDTGRALQP